LSSAATAVEMLLLFLPILGIAYLLYSLIWRPGVALVRWLAARLAASPSPGNAEVDRGAQQQSTVLVRRVQWGGLSEGSK